MNVFDKCCAALGFLLGATFILLGVLGLFVGCKANFVLPPILGGIPAFIGWGIVRSIVVAWNYTPASPCSLRSGPENFSKSRNAEGEFGGTAKFPAAEHPQATEHSNFNEPNH